MAKSNAERQADYRLRVKEKGDQSRLNLVVDSATDSMLEQLAAQHGITKGLALQVAMAVVAKDLKEAATRSQATGKSYRSSFERTLAELRESDAL